MTPLQAAKAMAAEVDKVLFMWKSNNPQSTTALVRTIDRLEQRLSDYEEAVEIDKLRKPDPRICEWPKCRPHQEMQP